MKKKIWSWYKLNSSKLKKIKLLLESYCALNWIVIQPNVEDESTLRAKRLIYVIKCLQNEALRSGTTDMKTEWRRMSRYGNPGEMGRTVYYDTTFFADLNLTHLRSTFSSSYPPRSNPVNIPHKLPCCTILMDIWKSLDIRNLPPQSPPTIIQLWHYLFWAFLHPYNEKHTGDKIYKLRNKTYLNECWCVVKTLS